MKKILAVASDGGHWVQMRRLAKAFDGNEVVYVSTNIGRKVEVDEKFYTVTDANFNQKIKLILLFIQMLILFIKERPDVVISTGAAPGFFAIVIGKLFRAKTLWLDSIANGEELSKSGNHVSRWADEWLTQWEPLSTKNGPFYKGKVL